MRRDPFLKSLAALAAGGSTASFPLSALAAANIKMMIPANPGGGWDTTGRALGKAMQDSGAASTVTFENKGGAAGALGMAQFVNCAQHDGAHHGDGRRHAGRHYYRQTAGQPEHRYTDCPPDL